MNLDADGVAALWSVYDAAGVRPEYLAPVLYFESGFNPAAKNGAGLPYYGINQLAGARLAALGTTVDAYLAMSQGAQIRLAVVPFYVSATKNYGPLASAVRAYQANFEPATLPRARSLASIVEPYGTRAYLANAAALDPWHTGAITLASLAIVMGHAAGAAEVRAAIAAAYAQRPAMAPPRDPVFGTDFTSTPTVAALALAFAAAAGAVAQR